MQIPSSVFLVTGGTRGIGRALVEALGREGARVAFSARDGEQVKATELALRGAGSDAIGIAGDVKSDADCRRLVKATVSAFGEIDVLINNAAILAPRATVVETPARVWEEVLGVNVIGTANMIRHVLPLMERRGRGAIINLSSGWGREASGHVASYCASKLLVFALCIDFLF
jgi:NAD(P)-dependent dehydrogenase (short-subunit alcohol dehydrogenase family)